MDVDLLIRRNRPLDGNYGRECWLHAFRPPGESTPILAVTNHPGDVVYDGVTFTAYPCKYAPPDVGKDSAIPTSELRISNVLRSLQPSLAANDWYRGFTLVSISYNDMEPTADYSDETEEMEVVSHKTDRDDIVFPLGVPQVILDSVPELIYSGYLCQHRFRRSAGVYGLRCGYTPLSIIEIQNPSGLPVVIRAVGCLPMAGQLIEIAGTGGLTPSLNGTYVCTADPGDVWNVTLDGTDGDDYTGTWDSAGTVGFYYCPQIRPACIARNRLASFGAEPTLRSGGLRIAV